MIGDDVVYIWAGFSVYKNRLVLPPRASFSCNLLAPSEGAFFVGGRAMFGSAFFLDEVFAFFWMKF